ncbi:AAA family ATPase [Teredinibacter haidensis]|uniref:AAA family ATPase n=1 Tax=Teredinibacter haidensis TaxID=2731755 RepID=UPI000948F59C|nr:AAA family ATPase [Teredinibacter haidensis]
MNKPTLYSFSGLPGSGKSTLAQALSQVTGFTYLRIDTIEQGLRDLCHTEVKGEGYRLSYRIATDNLKVGVSVIADSCNPIELTRSEWNEAALLSNANIVNIEVICSDVSEHKRRVKTRANTVAGLSPPKWEDIENREYHSWTKERLVIDTAGKLLSESLKELLSGLGI